MSIHMFSVDIASVVGVNAAVIYQNIYFWAEKNKANRTSIRDGLIWTYNSRRAFREQFPYLSDSQIKTAITKLVESKLIVKGEYNLASYDKTSWYAPSVSAEWVKNTIGQKSPMDEAEIANGLAENHQPIPDSKTDNKTDRENAHECADDLFSQNEETDHAPDMAAPSKAEETEEDFGAFWKVYPKKAAKPAARKAWLKATKKQLPEKIIAAAKKYADWLNSAKPGEFRPEPKHPQGWLNDERWTEFDVCETNTPRLEDLSSFQIRFLEDGRVPPSMMEDGQPSAAAQFWLKKFGFGRAA